MTEPTVSRDAVVCKLMMLIGACRQPRITKRQIEQSLEQYIKELSK